MQYTAQADVVDQRNWGEWIGNSLSTGLDYRQLQQPAGEVFFSGQFPAIDVRLKNDPVLAGDDALAAKDNAVPYNTFYDTNEFLYTFSYYAQERVSFWQDRIFLSGGYRWYHARATNADYIAGTLSETGLCALPGGEPRHRRQAPEVVFTLLRPYHDPDSRGRLRHPPFRPALSLPALRRQGQ